MVQRNLNASKASKTIGPFCAHSSLAVHTFDNSVADLSFGPEPIEDEPSMSSDHLCDLFDGLDFRAHRPERLGLEEDPSPMRAGIFPKQIELLLQQVCFDGLQVHFHQVLQLAALFVC